MGRAKKNSHGKNKNCRKQNEFSSGSYSYGAGDYYGSTCDDADVYRLRRFGMRIFWVLAPIRNKKGMEMVQVAILVAIAVTIGLIFKSEITEFVNDTFGKLGSSKF